MFQNNIYSGTGIRNIATTSTSSSTKQDLTVVHSSSNPPGKAPNPALPWTGSCLQKPNTRLSTRILLSIVPQYATTPMEIIHPFASHHSGLPYIRLTLPSIRKKRNGSMTKRSMKLTQSAFTRTGLVSKGMLVQPPTVIKPQSGKRNILEQTHPTVSAT